MTGKVLMGIRPYITYPGITGSAEVQQVGEVVDKCYVNEPSQVSFGVIDYVPGWFIASYIFAACLMRLVAPPPAIL